MVIASPELQKTFKYHHGNLRDALINASIAIVEQDGIEALSLRALAKATGVSQAAPYSHFQSKDDLLAVVAETGFQRLSLFLVEAAQESKSVEGRIRKIVTAYIQWALHNKALFQLMYGRELADMKKYPTLAMTAGKGYALISTVLAQRENAEAEDTRFMTAAVWSLCHGLTSLIIEDRLHVTQFNSPTLEAFVERIIALFSVKLA